MYAQFREEEHAAAALQNLSGRFYAGLDIDFNFTFLSNKLFKSSKMFSFKQTNDSFISSGRPIIVDFSPVTDFREATCRQYEENVCNRGGYCNFMHLKKINKWESFHIILHLLPLFIFLFHLHQSFSPEI